MKLCLNNCGKEAVVKFCSRSCSATYNNKLYPKRQVQGSCMQCNSPLTTSRSYCLKCSGGSTSRLRSTIRLNQWLSGEWDGSQKCGDLSPTIRKYILKQADYACSKCGFNTRHPDDNSCIIEINHIDGNGMNHSQENLEAICPNCHALTSSYRGRNIGFGRPVSYTRKRK